MPPSREYGHEQAGYDGNRHLHLQATTVGLPLTVPVAGGIPVLGAWQQIFHLECDVKPQRREIVATVTGEPDGSHIDRRRVVRNLNSPVLINYRRAKYLHRQPQLCRAKFCRYRKTCEVRIYLSDLGTNAY